MNFKYPKLIISLAAFSFVFGSLQILTGDPIQSARGAAFIELLGLIALTIAAYELYLNLQRPTVEIIIKDNVKGRWEHTSKVIRGTEPIILNESNSFWIPLKGHPISLKSTYRVQIYFENTGIVAGEKVAVSIDTFIASKSMSTNESHRNPTEFLNMEIIPDVQSGWDNPKNIISLDKIVNKVTYFGGDDRLIFPTEKFDSEITTLIEGVYKGWFAQLDIRITQPVGTQNDGGSVILAITVEGQNFRRKRRLIKIYPRTLIEAQITSMKNKLIKPT